MILHTNINQHKTMLRKQVRIYEVLTLCSCHLCNLNTVHGIFMTLQSMYNNINVCMYACVRMHVCMHVLCVLKEEYLGVCIVQM